MNRGELMGSRILVIDDEDDIRKIVSMILSSVGYTVDSVDSAARGVQLFTINEYSLIITDLVMPEKSGLELVSEIRKENSTIPIIICTGDVVQCSKEDNLLFLMKPVASFELLEQVTFLVNQYDSESQ